MNRTKRSPAIGAIHGSSAYIDLALTAARSQKHDREENRKTGNALLRRKSYRGARQSALLSEIRRSAAAGPQVPAG